MGADHDLTPEPGFDPAFAAAPPAHAPEPRAGASAVEASALDAPQAAPQAEDADAGPVRWRVTAAAAAGESHIRAGEPCQDAYCAARLNGTLILAVADGAGSAAHSAEGARAAVDAAVAATAAALEARLDQDHPADEIAWTELVSDALAAARGAVNDLAQARGLDPRQLATTLVVAACDEAWLAVAQIGDGAVVARTADGALALVLAPERGEYANETAFLTEPDALSRARYSVRWADVRALAAMTDGLLRLALQLPGFEPHATFFEPLFAFAAQAEDERAAGDELAAFLASGRVGARTNDDRALVLAAR